MMNKFLKLLFVALVLLMHQTLEASHIMGADISYSYEGNLIYKVTVKFYRDCKGIPLNSPGFKLRCADSAIESVLNFTRIAINDISLKCKDSALPCQPANTVSGSGVEEHVYISMLNFNISPLNKFIQAGCCELKISAEQCCRNGAITTIIPGNFYTEAMINICSSNTFKNSSPVFTSLPVQYLCVNDISTYDPGILNTDADDSISYELVAPLNDNNNNESYTSNFSPTKPITVANGPSGFNFDKKTGFIVMTPINSSEIGVVVIQVTEWRKDSTGVMKKMGYIRREMELIMKNCGTSNQSPYFTGNGNYSICEGNKICFTINTIDDPFLPNQTVKDTVELNWINPIPGATFAIVDSTSREKSAVICWQTELGYARSLPYTSTLIARDNHCGDPRLSYKPISITVKRKAGFTYKHIWQYRGLLKTEIYPQYTNSTYSYSRVIRDSSGAQLNYSTTMNDTFRFLKAGIYYIEHTLNESGVNCPAFYIDTIRVTPERLTDTKPLLISPFALAPNPGTGLFELTTHFDLSVQEITVHSVDGKVVKVQSGNGRIIDLRALPDGIYSVFIRTDQGNFTETLIISR